ncbi:MAG: hypothetical protein JHC84_17290 [Solirubrobacteraceae bacterium]|nr:hypothetical protein [Solirubrobacteraceae bacterium]
MFIPVRRIAALTLAAAALPGSADALVGTKLTTLNQPTDVAARDGAIAYTETDAQGQQSIVVRARPGATARPLGVPPQTRPFTLRLSAFTSGSAPGLAYPRCTGADPSSCTLAFTPLTSGVERIVPGTRGALRGAASGSRFVAAVESAAGIPRIVVTEHGRTRALRLPARRIDVGNPKPATIDPKTIDVTDLDLLGDRIAYVLTYQVPTAPRAESELWLQRIGGPPQLIARIGTGGASSGLRSFLGIRLLRDAVVAYRQGRDQGNALVKLSPRGKAQGRVNLGQDLSTDLVDGAYDRGRYVYVTAPYRTGQPPCQGGSPDEQWPGECALYDSGLLAFKR